MAYSGLGELNLNLYSSQKTQYLSNIYIVMPTGLTVDGGLAAMQKSLAQYTQIKPLNSDADTIIHNGTLTVQQLANTDGREVYEVTPSAGAYVTAGEFTETGAGNPALMNVPVRSSAETSGLKQILFNANTTADIKQDMLFVGAGDGQNVAFDDTVLNKYPQVTATSVGIQGTDDQYVRGIAYPGIQRSLTLFAANVDDNYTVIDANTKEIIKHVPTISGALGTTYSRVGKVDTLAALGIDSTVYDEKSLTIDQGNLNDTAVPLTSQDALSNDPYTHLAGHTYTLSAKRFAKDVTVKYVYSKGGLYGPVTTQLAAPVLKKGDIGDAYTTDAQSFDGYKMTKVERSIAGKTIDDATDGTLTNQAQTVTYYYQKTPIVPAADWTIKYADEAGNKIADPEIVSGNIDDFFSVADYMKPIDGYTLSNVQGEVGVNLTKDPQTTTLIYTHNVAGNVTVNYVDQSGNKLADPTTLTGFVNDPINAKEASVSGYTVVKTDGTPDGKFTDKTQTITYHYAKIADNVTVKYVDQDGKTISDADGDTTELLKGNVGDDYHATQKTISGYAAVKGEADQTGQFTDKAQTITYHYIKNAKDLTVKYEDADGQQLADSETITGNVGDSYTTVKKDISGYTFKAVTGQENGTLGDTAQTVIYVYTKDPVKGADVTVNYQDVDGNQIAPSKTLTGNVGTDYQAVQASIAGYTFKQVNGNAAGQFSDTAQTVTYVYTKNPVVAGNVTVNYQDEAGKQIAASETLTGNVDDSYHAVQKAITGYHFKAVTGEPDGRFTTSAQTITYVYTKDDPSVPIKTANQTVKYVDENGQTIASTEILTGNVGTPYHTTQKTIAGYHYKTITGAPDGLFAESAPVVTYIYTKNPVQGANITVNYQDADGNQIAASRTLTGNVGATYQAVQTPIAGYTYKQVSGNPTGTFGTVAQTVTYIYTKNPVQSGDVTVNYQDVDGNQIAASKTLTGNVGVSYQAVQASITGYTYKQVVGNATGQFSDKAQTVTYIYTKNATKPTQVIDPSGTKSDKQGIQSTTPTNNLKTQPQPVQKTVAKHKQQLPQTSVAKVSSLLGIIGALLIATVGMVFKKRRN
ncbi:hypothetical protein FC69_GL001995 [Latilactobacillus fuchuensis DSM 14340 = JCM 11249]|uniref:Gram-positive cocci surface proteins LPxTG domain-containing protein n=2 Tax=Latilactobacillus fuchuensis TaxID=164393 RepID=A0A0R1S038_9LACO|nr:hypothetical protein FC69_GL001995 [Latilactobacillus fuchuensis DSM 14340 = JCM 11249]